MQKGNRNFNFKLLLVYVLLSACSAYLVISEIRNTENELKRELITNSLIVSDLLVGSEILSLTGTLSDTSLSVYSKLKQDLHQARLRIPECRFTYLMGMKLDSIFFFVDSEPEFSEDMSPPGQVFTEAPAMAYKMFGDITTHIEGPYEDRWGQWVSCFIQIRDEETGRVISVFGADVSVSKWRMIIIKKSFPSLIFIIVALFSISIAFFLGRKIFLVRKENETSLMMFRDAVENSTVAIGMSSPEGKHYYQNKAFDELFGQIGSYPPDSIYVDKSVGDKVFDTIKTGGYWNDRLKMYSKSGKIIDVLLRAYANKDKNGKIISLVGIHTDITEQTNAEQELSKAKHLAEESSANIKSIIENTTENIWAIDRAYTLIYINNAFREEYHNAFGISLKIGDKILDQLPEPLSRIWKERYDRAFSGQHFVFEDEIPVVDQSIVFVQVSMNPIIVNNQIIGVSVFASNITERKLQENELIRAKNKAEESDRLKTAFLQNISHEIRTPLNAISGFASLLNKPGLSQEKQEYFISIIQNNSSQLVSIVSDILTISAIEAGQEKLHLEKVCGNSLLKELSDTFLPQSADRKIRFLIQTPLSDTSLNHCH
jgi:PAS domain S-box-containing protein